MSVYVNAIIKCFSSPPLVELVTAIPKVPTGKTGAVRAFSLSQCSTDISVHIILYFIGIGIGVSKMEYRYWPDYRWPIIGHLLSVADYRSPIFSTDIQQMTSRLRCITTNTYSFSVLTHENWSYLFVFCVTKCYRHLDFIY